MRILRIAFLFFCCFALAETALPAPADAALADTVKTGSPKDDSPKTDTPKADSPKTETALTWENLESGLDLASVTLQLAVPAFPVFPPTAAETKDAPPEGEKAPVSAPDQGGVITAQGFILRINPAEYSFSLYMASEKGRKAMADICRDENFIAAINAGMFLPDRLTNTGYLRQGAHANNARVAANFGSFFVAGPADSAGSALAPAKLLDRATHDWQKALREYSLVMQNYRMTSPAGRIIWKQVDRLHSIAALSQDTDGNILFIFCPDPVPATSFISALLDLPLKASSVMYLEGGSEAALVINAGGVCEMRTGRHASGLWSGGARLEIPNVLGVKRKPK